MKICSFFGHRDFLPNEEIEKNIKNEVINCLERGICEFYLGGKGKFDLYCAELLKNMKQDYENLKTFLILPYLNILDKKSIKRIEDLYDGTIYPPLENVPMKFRISKRNEWIIKNSDYLVFYVNYPTGGSSQTYQKAKKQKKLMINLGSYR